MNLRPAYILLLIMVVLTGVIYPLFMTLIGQTLLNYSANGSLIMDNGKIAGSELIGQNFTDPKYFWGRPSATTPAPYNAASSTGSNYSVLNPEQIEKVKQRAEALRRSSPGNAAPIPIDLVTASGSGLDPHISILAAQYQIPRVAKARGISEAELSQLVTNYTIPPTLGFLGEPRVNVLLLNRALDQRQKGS